VENAMLKLAQVGSVFCAVSLVLAFNGGAADAGLSSICVAPNESAASLLVQVKDRKWKNKKYRDGYDHRSRPDEGSGAVTSSGSTPATDNSQPGKGTQAGGTEAEKGAQAGGTEAAAPPNDAFTKSIDMGANIQFNQITVETTGPAD
jgi:hypothetical protein